MTFRVSGRIDLDGKQAKAEATATEGALARLKQTAAQGWQGVTGAVGKVKDALVGVKNAASGVNMRGVSQQLSQVGQMGAVTGNYLQALAVQLPDLGLMFGVAGAAIGTVAGIALPSLIAVLGGSSSEIKIATEALDALSKATGAYDESASRSIASTEDMQKAYGSMAAQARLALRALADIDELEAIRAARAAKQTGFDVLTEQKIIAAGKGFAAQGTFVADELELSKTAAAELLDALNALGNASGPKELAAAALTVQQELLAAYGSVSAMPAAALAGYEAMARITEEASRIQGTTEASTTSLWEFYQATLSGEGGLAAMGGQATSLAGIVATAAGNMWDMADAARAAHDAALAAANAVPGMSNPDPNAAIDYDREASAVGNQLAGINYKKRLAAEKLGGGGGGGAARAEADAVGELITKLQEELAIAREADPVKQAMIGYREELAEATDAERAQIEALTSAIEAEKLASESAQDAMDFFGDAGGNALMSLVKGGEEASNAMDNLKSAILDAALQALILGEGPLAGLFGGLLGFGSGEGIMDGIGSLLGFAGGGKIGGAGTGTSDSILARVSNGEYIVNAAATEKNLPLLNAINHGTLPAFAMGGRVGGGGQGGGGGRGGGGKQAPNINIEVNGARGNGEIRDMVEQGVQSGLKIYDREILPSRVSGITRGDRRTG